MELLEGEWGGWGGRLRRAADPVGVVGSSDRAVEVTGITASSFLAANLEGDEGELAAMPEPLGRLLLLLLTSAPCTVICPAATEVVTSATPLLLLLLMVLPPRAPISCKCPPGATSEFNEEAGEDEGDSGGEVWRWCAV